MDTDTHAPSDADPQINSTAHADPQTNGTAPADADADPQAGEDAVARRLGALTLVPDGGAAIRAQDLLAARPAGLVAKARSADELRALLAARFGSDELAALLRTDIGFRRVAGPAPDPAQAAPPGFEGDSEDSGAALNAALDADLMAFAAYVDAHAALEYRAPRCWVRAAVSDSGAALDVRRPVGLSHTGWAAVLAGAPGQAPRLYYTHVCAARSDNTRGGSLQWRRHPQFQSGPGLDSFGPATVHDSTVALWIDGALQTYSLQHPDRPARTLLGLDRTGAGAVSVAATEAHAAVVFADATAVLVWMDADSGRVAGCRSVADIQIEPEPETAAHRPVNPLNGQPLDDLRGLGTSDNDAAARLHSVHRPVCASFDEHEPHVAVLGTDQGCALLLDLAQGPDVVVPHGPYQLGTSAELDAFVGADGRHGPHYMHAGLQPPLSVRSRAGRADGSIVTVMPNSLSAQCRGALQAQLAGSTTRLPQLQERDSGPWVDCALAGTALVAHKLSSNYVCIGSVVPSRSGMVMRFMPGSPLGPDEPPFPLTKAPYRSLYVALASIDALMPDGRVLHIEPTSEEAHRAHMQKAAEAAAAAAAAGAY